MIQFEEVKSDKDYNLAAKLFKEYASQLNLDLSFQNFEEEIINIEEQNSKPDGLILIAYDIDRNPIGCFGIRKFADSVCELKRMYLKKEMRRKGIGKQLLIKAIESAKALNYRYIRLDTLPTMETAIILYEKMGFYEIDAYRFNPIQGTKYFEIQLND